MPSYGMTWLSLHAPIWVRQSAKWLRSGGMSFRSIVGNRVAWACWAGVSDRINARPFSCSSSNIRVPAYFPLSATIGSAPRNVGVITTWSPSTRQLTIRWWPSICQPHGSDSDGVPKIERK